MSGSASRIQDESFDRRSRASKGKSRSGCLACKERRVKCGEERPKCSRCTMQTRECVYEYVEEPKWKEKTSVFSVCTQPSSTRESSPTVSGLNTPPNRIKSPSFNFQHHFELFSGSAGKQLSPVPVESLDFDPHDKMLLEHFQASTSLDLILPQECWSRDIIQIALEHKFLMHAILAVSASHIRKLYENSNMPSGIDCHTLESHHLHLALSRIRVMFSEIDVVDNQDAFLGASLLFAIYYSSSRDFHPFASEPERGVWIHIKAAISIAQKNCEQARQGPFGHICALPLYYRSVTPSSGPLAALMNLLNGLKPRPVHYEVYVECIQSLTTLIATTTEGDFTKAEAENNLVWILRYAGLWSTEALSLASQYDQISSIIIAHWYAAGLYNIGFVGERWWFWREQPVLMIREVSDSLGKEWDAWMEWPLSILANSPLTTMTFTPR